jgi:glycogen debranching enzyme
LYDVVDGTRKDSSIRPNQIFAVSLPNSPLAADQQSAVVEVVRRELLTPMGLRTLARSDPRYHGRYSGPQRNRDEAYHNGIVWPWLIGGFLDAYLRVNHDTPDARTQAAQWLAPLIDQMNTACIGQIHEICEGDEPYRPVGCFAQAWSVAEVLRLAVRLGM